MAQTRPREPATWELVLKRNPVERLKQEKSPLGILDELPALIAAGYERVAEEDVVRLKWWGLYHDKPKIGTFMLRIKLPAGRAEPHQLRTIGELSQRYGRNAGELTTRQTVQLHYLELGALPQVLAELREAGVTTAGGCGDAVRNVTGCPVHSVDPSELFDVTPVVDEVVSFFYGNPDYFDLPRKHKITISACADRCNAPEINCIALIGVLRDGEPGFALKVGGGLSSVPRIARDLGVFIRPDEALPVLRALLDAWKEDLTYRVSRVKARIKFMVDDYGPDGMRAELERRLGYALPDFELPAPGPLADHLGVHDDGLAGHVYVGVPVHVGLLSGEQLVAIADLAEELGRDVRVTRQQNFIVTGIARERLEEALERLAAIGFPVELDNARGTSIACTGEPHCNFSVTETKTRLDALIQHLESRFGSAIAGLRLALDGCPHACAHHWIGDLGFQGTTVRDEQGKRRQAYDIFLRGGLGPHAAIGRPVFRRVPAEDLAVAVEGLVGGWLEARAVDESFVDFALQLTNDELGLLAGLEPSKPREVAAV
ncbi:MAG: nitrite/sulfite reductase [Gaiellaceae bacterium MAG52_C11]|nr:nitrite/sulfite reductase [Candidatus Gaiellasilicea maunaloa]